MMNIGNAARAMGNRGYAAWLPFLVLFLALAQQTAGAFETWQPQDRWRIGKGAVAPWAPAGSSVAPDGGLAGQVLRFSSDRVVAPEPLACSNAQIEFVLTPAEGIFQGMLAPPAERTARRLGISHLPLLSLGVTCSGGVFDYHLISSGKAVFGLDNIVWALERDRGDASPQATVLEFLREHMSHDMGFTPSFMALTE